MMKGYLVCILEKEMATHSNILAWRIPWTEEPGGLQSMGSHRVGHYRVIFLKCVFPKISICSILEILKQNLF